VLDQTQGEGGSWRQVKRVSIASRRHLGASASPRDVPTVSQLLVLVADACTEQARALLREAGMELA